ncbi:MAG: Zn-ribbon domain-containing OB-fold protein [Candidatus Thorarchaeota archaeon]
MIKASKCTKCERRIVPPRSSCPYCDSNETINVDLGNNGKVLSYTILHMPPEGFEPPVMLGLVELERDTITLCLGDKALIDQIEIGSDVIIEQDLEGRFLFRLKN